MAKRRKDRYFYLKDIDCVITVEYGKNKKDVIGWMDEMIENLQYSYYDPDDTVQILYEDGTEDYIDRDYDGHKIRRQHIESIVYSNDESYIVFGNFEMNECGVVYPAFFECIDDTNVVEVDDPNYSEYSKESETEEAEEAETETTEESEEETETAAAETTEESAVNEDVYAANQAENQKQKINKYFSKKVLTG